MSTPIIEHIAANILTTINTVTTAGDYNQDINCIRPKRVDFVTPWKDLDAVLNQLESEDIDLGNGVKGWQQSFICEVVVIDSDDSASTIDTRLNQIAADIEKALTADVTRGGYAIETSITGTQRFEADDAGPGGIAIEFFVDYRTVYNDPYTQA